jgi:hypothetical protein
MLPVGFEPAISAVKRLQTHALDSTNTNTGFWHIIIVININFLAGRIYNDRDVTQKSHIPNFVILPYFVTSERCNFFSAFFQLSFTAECYNVTLNNHYKIRSKFK